MDHLFTAWPKIADEVSLAGHIFLLSDYDGTLTPIVERPDMADLPHATAFPCSRNSRGGAASRWASLAVGLLLT